MRPGKARISLHLLRIWTKPALGSHGYLAICRSHIDGSFQSVWSASSQVGQPWRQVFLWCGSDLCMMVKLDDNFSCDQIFMLCFSTFHVSQHKVKTSRLHLQPDKRQISFHVNRAFIVPHTNFTSIQNSSGRRMKFSIIAKWKFSQWQEQTLMSIQFISFSIWYRFLLCVNPCPAE